MARQVLHDILCEVIGGPFPDGQDHCYFEPPANKEMLYPCIVYRYVNDDVFYADNIPYKKSKRYIVTIIDENPDSKIPDRLRDMIPYCSSDRNFAVDGLSHFVYTLFYDGPRTEEIKNEN